MVLALFVFHLWELEHLLESAIIRGKMMLSVLSIWFDVVLRCVNIDTTSAIDLDVKSTSLWLARHIGSKASLGMSSSASSILDHIRFTGLIENLVGDLLVFEILERGQLEDILLRSHDDKLLSAVCYHSWFWGDSNGNDFNI